MLHRLRPFRLIVALLTALLALGALQSPAQATTTRSITITASPSAAVVKGGVTISGKLSRSPKGSAVTIQRLSGRKWVTAKSTTTKTSTGAYSARVTLPATAGTYSYRAVAPKKGSLRAATSKVLKIAALRKVTATLKVTPDRIKAGQKATFTGTVRPFVANTTVTVQRLKGSSWVTLTTGVLNARGNLSKTSPVVNSGFLRLHVPRVGLNAPTTSPSTAIIVDPTISTSALPGGTVGNTYTATLTNAGGVPGTWTAAPLPAGLTLGASSGTISGTPTTQGTVQVRVGFTQALSGQTAADKILSLTIGAAVPPAIGTTSLPDGDVDVAYSQQLTATGGPGTWSTSSTLPAGLGLSSGGLISGTPTAIGASPVTTPITVKFTNTATGLFDTQALSITINPPPPPPAPSILTTSLPDAKVLTAYSAQLLVSGGVAGTWTVTGLPAGMTFNATTGAISGTAPLLPTTINLTVGFTETSTGTAAVSKQLTIKVANADPNHVVAGAGGQFSCRIDVDQALWCWGYDDSGELGDGGALDVDPAGVFAPKQVGVATDWTGLSTGGNPLVTERHACAIRGTTGYCWGSDKSGELGSSAVSGSSTGPVAISGGLAWSQLAAGYGHSCGITTAGALYCWGGNPFGQLGTGGGSVGTPTQVGTQNDWVQVAAGYNHSCAVKADNSLWCWGMNARGQLGVGNNTTAVTPLKVTGGNVWSSVVVGSGYTCAIRTTGTLWCWGPSANGELGNGTSFNDSSTDALVPLQVGAATNWTDVAIGDGSSCATNGDGELWCWGKNSQGQLGVGDSAERTVPTKVGTATDWESVSVGDSHTCAVKSTGAIWCSGNNNKGQLGSPGGGSNVPRAVVG